MEPFTRKVRGRELGNAAACGQACYISWETWEVYVRRDRARRAQGGYDESMLAPDRYAFDDETGLAMWDMRKVRAWQLQRRGPGNWKAIREVAARRAQAAQEEAPAGGEPAGDLVSA